MLGLSGSRAALRLRPVLIELRRFKVKFGAELARRTRADHINGLRVKKRANRALSHYRFLPSIKFLDKASGD